MTAHRNIQNKILKGKQSSRRSDAAKGFLSWAPSTVAVTAAAAKAAMEAKKKAEAEAAN